MAHPKLIECRDKTPTQDEDWTPIADIYIQEHLDLCEATYLAEGFAKKHKLLPQSLHPTWVASERDVPADSRQPAYHWESAHVHFEAPLGNKERGLHFSLAAQTIRHLDKTLAVDDYLTTMIRVNNFGEIYNERHELETSEVLLALHLFGPDPDRPTSYSFLYYGGLKSFGPRISANMYSEPGIQISFRNKISDEPIDLFANGRLQPRSGWVTKRLTGLSLMELSRLDPTKALRLMTFLTNQGIIASTSEDFWRIFSTDAVK